MLHPRPQNELLGVGVDEHRQLARDSSAAAKQACCGVSPWPSRRSWPCLARAAVGQLGADPRHEVQVLGGRGEVSQSSSPQMSRLIRARGLYRLLVPLVASCGKVE